MVKFQEAKQDQGGIEEGLIEALKDLRAEISVGEVRAWTRRVLVWKRQRWRRRKSRKSGIVGADIFGSLGFSLGLQRLLRERERERERESSIYRDCEN